MDKKKRTFQEVCEDAMQINQFMIDFINQRKYWTWAEFVFATMWVNLDQEIICETLQ